MSALRQDLARLKGRLEEADELLRDKERQAKALRIAKRRQAQQLAELEAALRTLRTSTSWRVTRPLRTLGRVLRRS